MTDNADKEQWIDEVLNSTGGIMRAKTDDGLYDRVMLKILQRKDPVVKVLPAKQWAAAAILLLAINLASILYATGKEKAVQSNPFEAAFHSNITYNY